MYKILIVEDDPTLCGMLKEHLERYDYQVYSVEDFRNIESRFEEADPHLVLLDINLPYYDGFYLCRVLRRKSQLPIIIISARSSEAEQVAGVEYGADDYIVKPFSLDVLLAKVKAALRRSYGEYTYRAANCLRIGKLSLDESSFRLGLGTSYVELSKNEFKLIKALMENRDKIVSREELLEVLWDENTFADENTLNVNMTRVRNRFRDIGAEEVVHTKRGVGYILNSSLLGG